MEMRYGHIDTYIAKVLLFGIVGSGKTSVTAIMTGEDPPQDRNSTPLMAHPVQVTAISTDNKQKWEKKTPEEVREIIAKIIRSRKSQRTHSKSQQKDSYDNQPRSSHSEQVQQMEDQPPQSHKSDFDYLLEKSVKDDDILSLVHNSDSSPEQILEQKWLYIIDSGGQPEFHNMLSIFVQRTTACIFIFRMHDGLNAHPYVAFYKGGSAVGSSHKSRLTNGQIFEQFMRTMRSFSSKVNEDPPSIALLATHRDQVKADLLEESELPNLLEESESPDLLDERHELEERCKLKWNQKLEPVVLPQFKKQLIYCGEPYKEFIFTMNVQKPDESDKKAAKDILTVITKKCLGEDKIAKKCLGEEETTKKCLGEKEEIPIRWYFLDHRSRMISKRLKRKVEVLSREEYGRIAESLDINKESCDGALNFFHRLNTIFYFPEDLPNVVFLEPQILLDILTKLVVKKYLTHTNKARRYDECNSQFHEHAQVTEEFLDKLDDFGDLGFKKHYVYDPPLFTSKELVKLFEKLLIFGKLGEGKWFVPSILQSLEEKDIDQHRVSGTGALLIHFPDGGPQNGLFCSTVSYLLSSYNTSPSPWEVLKDSYGKPRCLKHNVISFTVGGFPGKVILIEEWTHFEIHLETRPAREEELWHHVYKAVFKGLEKAAETHHYSNSDNVPCAAIRCPKHCHDHSSTPHSATVDREGNWVCTKSTEWFDQVPTETIPWLNLITEEVSGIQQQREQSSQETGVSGMQPQLVHQILPPLQLAGESQQDTSQVSQEVREPSERQQEVRQSQGETDMFHSGTIRSPPSKKRKITTGEKPTMAQLTRMKSTTGEKIKIIESVAPQWKELGYLLDFDPEGRTVELIEVNHRMNGVVACCREMFATWLKGKGREATWEVLIELLDDLDQPELAKMVKTALH